MTEVWKDIPGYEGRYQVSDLGRVRAVSFPQRYLLRNGEEAFRIVRERILAQQKQNSGYMLVHLYLDNQRKALTVHRIVAQAFVPGSGRTVNHRNGVKTDNRACNLEWLSYSENLEHAVATGLRRNPNKAVGWRCVGKTETVQIFASISAAERTTKTCHTAISRSANSGKPDHKGREWVWL